MYVLLSSSRDRGVYNAASCLYCRGWGGGGGAFGRATALCLPYIQLYKLFMCVVIVIVYCLLAAIMKRLMVIWSRSTNVNYDDEDEDEDDDGGFMTSNAIPSPPE